MRRLGLIALGVAGFAGLAGGGGTAPASVSASQARPNIVVIETDDQAQASLAFMPKTRALLAAQGVTFDNSFVSYSLCCPSRSTFLTGQYAHNHGVLGNSPPAGGYEGFKAKHATNNLAVWLQKAGYYTALIGKFLNGYGAKGTDASVPPGWSEWHAGVDLSFLGGTMSDNGKLDRLPATEAGYQTDVWSRTAQDLIARRAPSTQPFFLWLTPHVPHAGGPADPDDPQPVAAGRRTKNNGGGTTRPPARYRNRFANEPLPMPPSLNEADVSDKPSGVRDLPLLTPAQIADIREAYQQMLEADLGVDDMVTAVVDRLKASGELDNTLIVFTSDNGFMYGEHRIARGKVVLYEPSIRVPLIVRGPGVPKGVHLKQMAANIDLAPTIVDAAGAKPGLTMDGRSLFTLFRTTGATWRTGLVIERGPAGNGKPARNPNRAAAGKNKVFVALRTPQYLYAQYTDGEQELYDLARDPHELANKASDPAYAAVRSALAARLTALKSCAGAACWQH